MEMSTALNESFVSHLPNLVPAENISMPSWLDDISAFNNYIEGSLILGCCLLCVSVIGVIGNVISIFIFSNVRMRSPINILLAGLSSIDMALLILMVLVFGLQMINAYAESDVLYDFQPYALKFFYPMNFIMQTSSVWTMVAITVERWIAVCHALRVHKCSAVLPCFGKTTYLTLAGGCAAWAKLGAPPLDPRWGSATDSGGFAARM